MTTLSTTIHPVQHTMARSASNTTAVMRTKPKNATAKVGLSLANVKQGIDGQKNKFLITKVHTNSLFAGSAIQANQELVSVNGIHLSDLTGGVKEVVQLLQSQNTLSLVVVTTPTKRAGASTSSSRLGTDDYQDIDACEMGQFLINPCWFLYLKLKSLLGGRNGKKTQRYHQVDPKVERTLWMSNLQQFIYLTSFYSVWWVVFTKAIPLNRERHYLSTFHEIFTCALFVVVVLSWIAAKTSSPGCITSHTILKFDNYDYDGILYHPGSICPTQKIRKLARSKFDRYTKQNVPRFDHFCGWLGNTIGEENYRFFMAFLALHAFMVLYGFASVGYLLYRESILLEQDYGYSFWSAAFVHHPSLAAACLWNFLASFPTGLFFLFHLSLIQKGMTTNEYYKWKQILKENHNLLNTNKQLVNTATGANDIEGASTSIPSPSSASVSNVNHCYNLGLVRNFHEVFFPRSLRITPIDVRLGYKES